METFRNPAQAFSGTNRVRKIMRLSLRHKCPSDPRIRFTFRYVSPDIIGGDDSAAGPTGPKEHRVLLANVTGQGLHAGKSATPPRARCSPRPNVTCRRLRIGRVSMTISRSSMFGWCDDRSPATRTRRSRTGVSQDEAPSVEPLRKTGELTDFPGYYP